MAPAQGFTLIELLSVLAVLAVFLTVTIPSMRSLVDSIRISTASNTLISGLHLARSEAIKRNSRVVLCKSANGQACASSGGWEQGWIIFHDADNDGRRRPDEAIILREQSLSPVLSLMGNLNVARYVSFTPSGATRLVGGGFQAGTLTICRRSLEGGQARQIVLNAVGRPRVQKTVVGYCG